MCLRKKTNKIIFSSVRIIGVGVVFFNDSTALKKNSQSIVYIGIVKFWLSIFFEALFEGELKIEYQKLDAILQIREVPNIEPVIHKCYNVFFYIVGYRFIHDRKNIKFKEF